jgi:2-polyprenyl-3-methyl-5-hydroxy-6-metoxy-1,4-benzoquinol methylase
MNKEIKFDKYESRGEGYHWEQNSSNPLRMSAFIKARYTKCINLLEVGCGSGLNGLSILDFGCGDGAFAYDLFRCGARVSGVDNSSIAIEYARRRHGNLGSAAEFHCASCYDTPFASGSFDALVSTDVIEHVQHTDQFLREIYRLLKPGGIAVVSTPIRLTEGPLDRLHVTEWFPTEFERLIREHFSDASFHKSHPTVWHEIAQRSKLLNILVNTYSLFDNPYLHTRKWQIFSQQYALCLKHSERVSEE